MASRRGGPRPAGFADNPRRRWTRVGGVAEWSKASRLKRDDRKVRGFESYPLRQRCGTGVRERVKKADPGGVAIASGRFRYQGDDRRTRTRRGGRAAEGNRLLSGWSGKTGPRVRIPASPPNHDGSSSRPHGLLQTGGATVPARAGCAFGVCASGQAGARDRPETDHAALGVIGVGGRNSAGRSRDLFCVPCAASAPRTRRLRLARRRTGGAAAGSPPDWRHGGQRTERGAGPSSDGQHGSGGSGA